MYSNYEVESSNVTECNSPFHNEGYGERPAVIKSVNKKNLQTNNGSAVPGKQYTFNTF